MQRRILLLVTDLQIGGTPTVVRELALRLSREPEAHVRVGCLDRSGPVADQLREHGIDVTPLGACCNLDARVLFRLIRLIQREKIDTVLSFLIHANAAAAIACKLVGGIKNFQSIQTTQPNPRWHWKLQHMIQHAAARIVVPSPSVAEAAEKWAGIPAEKISVIPNAVEFSEFSRPSRSHAGQRVGFIGRLDPIKRIGDLVTAISLLPGDIGLDIFGEGQQRREIESSIQRLNLRDRVNLRGSVNGPAEALAGIDVLVLCSDAEGFGLVLIEAMAAGVPVIGTNVAGIRDVIQDGKTGLLVPPRNPRALSNAIAKILADISLRETLVAGGKESVQQRYAWTAVYPQYRALLLGNPA